MGMYIALTVLTDEGRKAIKEQPEKVKEHNKALASCGVKVKAQYITLGQYDFVTIMEAPNEDAIFRAAVKMTGRGVLHAQTLTARSVDEFIALAKK